jgi:hypothetical protein
MKRVFLIGIILFSTNIYAAKQLSAHMHGSLGLDIAADGKQVFIMLKSPTDSFLGFEYKAKTKKEKALIKNTKLTWVKNIKSLFQGNDFESCSQGQSKWELKYEGTHSEIVAEAYLNCKDNVAGRSLNIRLKEKYPRIKTIHLQLLRSNGSALNKKIKSEIYNIKL